MQGASLGMSSRFYVEPALDSGIKNAGGKPPALGGPSIRGYRHLYSRSCALGLRETFGSTDSLPKNKNAGGIPRPLTALHKGTQPFYTTRRASDPSGDDVPASCTLKVDSASLADGAHELIYVGHGSCSARVFTAFNKRLSSACCSVRWLARYKNPPEFVKGKARFLVILGPTGFGELGDCLLRCLDENAR